MTLTSHSLRMSPPESRQLVSEAGARPVLLRFSWVFFLPTRIYYRSSGYLGREPAAGVTLDKRRQRLRQCHA